ncbi:hypothetical protein [Gelidibacter japonicus]|uniref:hypothetical protein n=1 Tax=Gelidibacter japonicus TaxID=1962232 RepID=UPI003A93CDE9
MSLYENDIKVVDELRFKAYADGFVLRNNHIFSAGMNRGFEEEDVNIEEGY